MRTGSAPTPPGGRAATDDSPLVARRVELAALRDALGSAIAGDGCAVFVGAEPGGGKSRLLAAIADEARSAGAEILAGACVEELGRPLEPFDAVIEQLLRAPDGEGGADAGDRNAHGRSDGPAAAGPEAPDALALLGTAFDAASPAPQFGQPRLFEAVAEAVLDRAGRTPVVLVLDDLHWADDDAVRLLERLVLAVAGAPVLLLGAYRPDPPDRSAGLSDVLGRVSRLPQVSRILLAPFDEGELAEYLVEVGGIAPEHAARPAHALAAITGGNPFLVRETWRHLLDAIAAGDPGIAMPETTYDLLRPRVAMLSGTELEVVGVAAIMGQEVDLSELLACVDAPPDAALRAVDAIVHAGLLERPTSDDRYRFPHAIARQAMLDAIPPSEAIRIHARVAETLEARFPAAPRLVQRLAFHYDAARALGYADRAVTFHLRAAESADRRLAHEQAATLLERASELTARVDECERLRERAARSWMLAADFAAARRLRERNLESADARTRVRAAIGYEDASWRPGLTGERAAELLSTALEGIPADDRDPLHVEASASLGRAIAFTGQVDEGAERGERALEAARALGDERTLAAALRARIAQPARPTELPRRILMADELARLAAGMDEDWLGLAGMVGAYGYVLGDAEALARAERRLADVGRRWGPYWQYWLGCVRYGDAFMQGRLEDATARLVDLEYLEAGFRSDASDGVSATQEFMVRRERGRLGPALRVLNGEESPASTWAPGLLVLYLEAGWVDPARRVLHWLLEHTSEQLRSSADWPARLAFMAEGAVACGDVDAARAVRPLVAEYAGCNLMLGFYVAVLGPADRWIGELDAVTGDGDPARSFASAIGLSERIGATLHLAHDLVASAEWARRLGDETAAAGFATRARGIAESHGMVRVLERLGRVDPRGTGAITARGHDAGDTGPGDTGDELTPREREVLGLVAEGLSNREIAGRLVISEHTAANHVRSILMKTGASNRTGAARYARDHNLA
ncbi:AAA family ATPase [Agromyces sp. MMS24-JH15]|uniref:helix-turn-helix transcriptional regulator n=1 Tax=Agromyces sp. MMS24-JH15 TaxID=3243765 RepID=UPI0037482283